MNIQKKLVVGLLLFAVTLLYSMPTAVFAYTAIQINQDRSTTKYKFSDKNASAITMNIGGKNLTFKRDTTPPKPTPSSAPSVIPDRPAVYTFVLQDNTDDGCKTGFPELASQFDFQTSSTQPVPARISVPASNIDNNPDPNKIDGSLLFFHQVDGKCTNKDVESAIQINNPFGKNISVPAAQRAVSGAGGSGTPDTGPSCDVSLDSPLSWILCPLIEGGSDFVDFIFNKVVKPILSEVPISPDPQDKGYLAWKQFRLIGNIVLVGTMLAVVYAQVRGDR